MINADGFLHERVETLYVAAEYKLFLLTGQAQGRGRRAYIAAKPFNTLTPDALEAFTAAAKPVDANSRISISADQESLRIRDGFTGTTSSFPIAALDADIRTPLQSGADTPKGEDPFTKFEKPAAPPAGKRVFRL